MDRIQTMKELRQEGKTLREIGKICKLTEQRVSQLLGHVGRLSLYPKGYRKCYGYCKKVLLLSEFYGSANRCRKCTKVYVLPYVKKYIEKYRNNLEFLEKSRARNAVYHAVQAGKIQKGQCYLKDNSCFGKIQAHHYKGYSLKNWLVIKWICRSHHMRLEKIGFAYL